MIIIRKVFLNQKGMSHSIGSVSVKHTWGKVNPDIVQVFLEGDLVFLSGMCCTVF